MDSRRLAEVPPSMVDIGFAAAGEAPARSAAESACLCFGPFALFPAQQLLLRGDTPVRLGSRALSILVALVRSAGTVVSKDELLETGWPGLHVEDSNLRVGVAALRRALGHGRYIQTVPLRGYCFVAPVTMREAGPIAIEPEPVHDLTRQLADHATLLDGLIAGKAPVQLTEREAALLGLQILALDAAIMQVLGKKQLRSA